MWVWSPYYGHKLPALWQYRSYTVSVSFLVRSFSLSKGNVWFFFSVYITFCFIHFIHRFLLNYKTLFAFNLILSCAPSSCIYMCSDFHLYGSSLWCKNANNSREYFFFLLIIWRMCCSVDKDCWFFVCTMFEIELCMLEHRRKKNERWKDVWEERKKETECNNFIKAKALKKGEKRTNSIFNPIFNFILLCSSHSFNFYIIFFFFIFSCTIQWMRGILTWFQFDAPSKWYPWFWLNEWAERKLKKKRKRNSSERFSFNCSALNLWLINIDGNFVFFLWWITTDRNKLKLIILCYSAGIK